MKTNTQSERSPVGLGEQRFNRHQYQNEMNAPRTNVSRGQRGQYTSTHICVLNAIEISEETIFIEKDVVLEAFNGTIGFQNGRYEVAQPWKSAEGSLVDSRNITIVLPSTQTFMQERDYQSIRKSYQALR